MTYYYNTNPFLAPLLNEKISLIKYDAYAKLVAHAFKAAPKYEATATKHWDALAQSSNKLFKRLLSDVEIIFTTSEPHREGDVVICVDKVIPIQMVTDPYETAAGMRNDYLRHGRLFMSCDFDTHPYLTYSEFMAFRVVHDFIVHIQGKKDFGSKGEIQAYNLHARLAPPMARAAIFTEIVGRANHQMVFGTFPDAKVAVLHGFDLTNVGQVDMDTVLAYLPPNQRRQLQQQLKRELRPEAV